MDLESYLKAIESCPELISQEKGSEGRHVLTLEYGVYDNFPMLLKADYERVRTHLLSANFQFKPQSTRSLIYCPGTVVCQLLDHVPERFGIIKIDDLSREHHTRQLAEFNVGIMLHDYQEKQIENVHRIRAIAIVLKEIGDYALKEKIPLCLPRSIGWKYRNDLSRIVYYP